MCTLEECIFCWVCLLVPIGLNSVFFIFCHPLLKVGVLKATIIVFLLSIFFSVFLMYLGTLNLHLYFCSSKGLGVLTSLLGLVST